MSKTKTNREGEAWEDPATQTEVQPWHRLGGMEHICELRKSAQVLYGIFVTILRMIYSSKKGRTFGCPDVVWKSDPQKTQLWIDTELRWEDLRPDFTPAIFVSLGEIKYEFPPTLDMQCRTFMNRNGEQHYERTGIGSASIVHVCDKAGAACALADNTENYISSMQDQIGMEYCFENFVVTSRLPRQLKETPQTAGKGKYMSVVTVNFKFEDAWMVKFETPILKTISTIDTTSGQISVTGTNVDIANGHVEIQFGDVSTEDPTPFDK